MKKEIKVKIKVRGHADGILTREKVLENYHQMLEFGRKEGDEGFYNGIFYLCEAYIEPKISKDWLDEECEWEYVRKSEENKIINFIKQVVEEEKKTALTSK